MDLRQIKQHSTIAGVKRNPNSNEDGKFEKYNHTTEKIEYVCVGDGGDSDINTTYFTNFVTNIFDGITTDDYLNGITKIGNTGRFTLASGTYHDLSLGALAWLDSIEADITLPGDTKVLFDDNDTVGGENALTYNKTTNKLQFQGTSLSFDLSEGSEGTYKEGLKYNGNYSWSVGNGIASTSSGNYNIKSGYKAGSLLGSSSLRNTIYGSYAGELAGSTLSGSIFIGAYSGRYETASNKFFLDNKDHGDTATARTDSFLYADLDTERRLYIRDRLSVEKEGKFGYSELTDAEGEYGMYQMSATTGGNPQWHDGSVWQEFANGTNVNLASTSFDGTSITFTLSDATVLPTLDISTINSTTFATSPSSPSTGQTTSSDYGYIQLSNSSFTDNEGFTYTEGLVYNSGSGALKIPGALEIATSTSTYSDGSISFDGSHFYGKIDGISTQLDNDEPEGESITGLNIGGATYEWFKQRDEDNLEFRTVQTAPIDSDNPNDRVKISYSSDGDAIVIGTTAERNRLDSVVDSVQYDVALDRDNSGETLLLRALRPGTGVTLTQTEEYITIDSTGAGGGEVNTMTNLGAGEGVYYQKNGAQFELKSIKSNDTRLTCTSSSSEIILDLAYGVQGANNSFTSTPSPVGNYAEVFDTITGASSTTPTLNFRPLVCADGSIIINENGDEILLSASGAVTATCANIGTGVSLYETGSSVPFNFRTLSALDHIDIDINGDVVDFDVDDITFSNLSTGVYNIVQDISDSFVFNQRAFTEGYAITLDNDTNTDLIEVSVNQNIPYTQWDGGTGITYSGGLLSWTVEHSDDIVNTLVSTETVAEINIGDGLSYDLGTNTLSANVSSGSGTPGDANDYRLISIVDNSTSTNYIKEFTVGNGSGSTENVFSMSIPKYSLPEATYSDNASASIGGIVVDKSSAVWTLNSSQDQLTLDELTGTLSMPLNIVAYDAQNELLDGSQDSGIITKRNQARANIGAAYIQGSTEVDFNTADINIDGAIDATDTPTTTTHKIGNLEITDQIIQGNTSDSTLTIQSTDDTGFGGTGGKIELKKGYVNITIGNNLGSQGFQVKDTDGNNLMLLSSTGDLFIYGNIYATGDIKAFKE